MRTMRPGASRASRHPVVSLRPRQLARRAAGLQRRLDDRLATHPTRNQRAMEVIADVLARADRVPEAEHDAWERFLDLLEEHEETSCLLPACAAVANLLGLALWGETEDHLALADLAERIGHDRLARMQHRYGIALEGDRRLPLTSDALRRMLRRSLRARLLADPETEPRAEAIDDASLRCAHALLVQGVDRAWTVPALDSVEELVDIADLGTIVEWRHHVAMILADAWSPYPQRVVELAQQAGDAHAATVIATIVDLCREQAAGVRYPAGRGVLADGRAALRPAPRRRVRYSGGRAAP